MEEVLKKIDLLLTLISAFLVFKSVILFFVFIKKKKKINTGLPSFLFFSFILFFYFFLKNKINFLLFLDNVQLETISIVSFLITMFYFLDILQKIVNKEITKKIKFTEKAKIQSLKDTIDSFWIILTFIFFFFFCHYFQLIESIWPLLSLIKITYLSFVIFLIHLLKLKNNDSVIFVKRVNPFYLWMVFHIINEAVDLIIKIPFGFEILENPETGELWCLVKIMLKGLELLALCGLLFNRKIEEAFYDC